MVDDDADFGIDGICGGDGDISFFINVVRLVARR